MNDRNRLFRLETGCFRGTGGLSPTVLSVIDGCVPLHIRTGDADLLRRARLAVAFASTLISLAVVYALVYQLLGSPWCVATLLAGGAAGLGVLCAMRWTGSCLVTGNLIALTFYGVLTALACHLGGYDSNSLLWYAGIPVVALSVAGRRSAIFWLLATASSVSLFYALDHQGHTFPHDLAASSHKLIDLLSLIGLTGFMLGLTLIYEAAKNRALGELKSTEAATRMGHDRAHRQRNAIAALAVDDTVAFGDVPTAMRTLTQIASDTVQVERASVWLFADNRQELRCVALFEASSQQHSEGAVLRTAEYPRYFRSVAAQSRIDASDACTDHRTSELAEDYLIPLGITSMLDAGIMLDGELAGVVCMEHTETSRSWHSDEEAFASTLAALAAQTLANANRKKAEHQAASALALAEATLESTDNGILVTDEDRNVVKANTMFERLWRIPKTVMNDSDDQQLLDFVYAQLSAPEEFIAKVNELYRNTELESFDTIDFKDGRVFERYSKPTQLNGGATARVWSFRDITKRKQAEQQIQDYATALERNNASLEQLNRAVEAANRAKSDFLANMSHEIRTPMTAILGFAEVLMEKAADQEQLDAARTIRRNGQHLIGIINDILDISKIEAGKLDVEQVQCSPCEIIAEVIALMQVQANAKKLPLEVDYDGPIPTSIRSDPNRLRQILINLIGNAIKFTETGKIRLVARLLNAVSDNPSLQFKFVDSGIGMTEQQIANLFKPFHQADTSATRKFGGTGLGLVISKRLAAKLGGTITVKSLFGKGSTFTVTIATGPLDNVPWVDHPADKSPAAVHEPQPTARHSQLRCRVLLAEDGPDNQRLIAFLLKKAGAEVTVAENGQIAHDLALAARDRGLAYDVVLMDMQMPVMDGYEATRKLRNADYDGPVIALTAHAMSKDRDKCLAAGCNDYMTKPIDRKKLIAVVAHFAASQTPA